MRTGAWGDILWWYPNHLANDPAVPHHPTNQLNHVHVAPGIRLQSLECRHHGLSYRAITRPMPRPVRPAIYFSILIRKMTTIVNLQRISAAKLSELVLAESGDAASQSKLAVVDVRDDGTSPHFRFDDQSWRSRSLTVMTHS